MPSDLCLPIWADHSSDPGERGLGFGANAGNHRLQAVRALRGEVLAQVEPLEQGGRVDRQNVARGLVGTQGEQDCDQPADDMGVAVALEREDRSAGAVRPRPGFFPQAGYVDAD